VVRRGRHGNAHRTAECSSPSGSLPELCKQLWKGRVIATTDHDSCVCCLDCRPEKLVQVCDWLVQDLGFAFATLIVEEEPESVWLLTYIFFKDRTSPRVHVELRQNADAASIPSISTVIPAADWHEREAEDLFGLTFEGHPRLGEFIPARGLARRRQSDAQKLQRAPAARPQGAGRDLGAAGDCDSSRRIRHADRPGVLGFC
jgi:NADH:ubiquinone oxidoreductase subunit C